ncbi:MAG: helix-turn-helix transcriptional regulator [Roseburia sp.]|uniref:helix-turn-helix transcriptional regulator n=1 Tax=Roseburia sp. 831b TaxID=1261635 RepID=UPI00095297FD|nr:helix-turn-helix transcriptional regulator [Roseburia sp. 831b]MCI5918100.1 helix-turn-helix transcriptional regulator [Roseburia sp.]MDD6217012.1 helix-turn-helix transcriptional regulator [Roseburia sp.]WVK71853.1 helix-turn-helix transcriptional regulator [Roseburia sp. 831b]
MQQQDEKLKIGKIYKDIREMTGFSQEDVSMGLLSAKELSRFENDESYPGSYMIQMLFERVGKSLKYFIIMMSKPEYEYQLWGRNIVAQVVRGERIDSVVYSGSSGKYMDAKLHLQFCTFWQGY